MNLAESAEAKFKELYNEQPLIVRSPGRVNLIGEHTDYNHGYVLPAAIDRAIYFAISPRVDDKCEAFALDMNEGYQFSIHNLQFTKTGWPNYLMGVVDQFIKARCKVGGFNCVFGGNIPIGAGLSSSAAIEAGLAFTLNYLFDLKMEDLALVKLAQRAENEFVGVQCGIMDQYINIYGKSGYALRIDCRSLDCEYYPFAYDVSIVLFESCISRSLASSEYNKRREECQKGVDALKETYPKVTHLRDVSMEMLDENKKRLDETVYKRCKYVVEENARVLKACEVLKKKNLKAFGQYMFQTHTGLSREYEVSCRELDFLVESVMENDQVYGARMMGGGFGGCSINLIENDAVDDIIAMVSKKYRDKFHIELKTHVTSISQGTSIVIVNEQAKI